MDGDFEQVQDNSFINDIRDSKDFKTVTFSGYKKTEVKKEFINSMLNSKVENACNWCAELVCSGHYMDIWEILLLFVGKHIHLGNPKLSVYLEKRFNVFRNIMIQGLYYDEMQLRNNPTIRNMFAEICTVFSLSPKKPSLECMKINRGEDFDMTQVSNKLKADSNRYSEPILKKKDPKEIAIAINEFCFQISSNDGHIPNLSDACYWIEWIICFDQICKKRKQQCYLENRDQIPVEHKFQKEIIWAIWDSLFYYCKNDTYLKTVLNSILQLFCVKFNNASIKKRIYLLYFAVSVVTEPFTRNVNMIQEKEKVQLSLSNINFLYKNIKKEEVSPQTDYLFAGLHQPSNIEKTMQKLDILNSVNTPSIKYDGENFPEKFIDENIEIDVSDL